MLTKEHQLQLGLFVCETVLEALVRTHPEPARLQRELQQAFARCEAMAVTQEWFQQQECSHLQTSMNAFLSLAAQAQPAKSHQAKPSS
jgi:hypothetical protein